MDALIIEILDRFGKIKERHRVDSFPYKIGRGFSNHLIVDDPYISPSHITIEQSENGFSLTDTDSSNGVFQVHPLQKISSLDLENNSRIRIGHTDIRFHFTNHKITETLKDRDMPSQLSMLVTNGFILPIIWFIFSCAFMLDTYIESTGIVTFQKLLSETFPLILVMAIWALIWSVVSKLVTRRFYFSFHAAWVTSLTLASTLIDNFSNYIEFIFSLEGSSYFMSLIASLIITSTLLYGHLHYSSTFSVKKAKLASIFTSVVIIGIIEIFSLLNATEYSNTPKYSAVIKPPAFILTTPDSVETFFNQTNTIRKNIDNVLLDHRKTKKQKLEAVQSKPKKSKLIK